MMGPGRAARKSRRRNRTKALPQSYPPMHFYAGKPSTRDGLMFLLVIIIPLSALLGAAAALHFYWAAGGLRPARTPRQLIDTVIGDPRLTRMPPAWLTALVGLALTAAAVLPVIAFPPLWMPLKLSFFDILHAMEVMAAVGFIFIARGIMGYLPFWRRRHSAQPFARYDVWLYSPLCLLLGAAQIGLAFLIVLVLATI
jgi:hypothetical protein